MKGTDAMIRTLRPLLALPLLLALAAPVAAVEPSPEPALYGETPACPPVEIVDGVYVIPKDAPEGCVYVQDLPSAIAEPMPIAAPVGEPAPCSDEVVAAVAAGSPGAIVEACLLPDGSLLPSNVMTVAEPPLDPAPDYEAFLEAWKQGLPACPEGTDPAAVDMSDPSFQSCLLADGTVVGPMPLFAPMPRGDEGADGIAKDAEAGMTNEGLLQLLALTAVISFVSLVLIARQRSA